MRILDLIDLNRGETLKQGDSTLLRFQIADRDHILPDRAGEQARVVFMHNNSIVHEELTTVLIGNIVEFSISEILPPNVYSLEIHVGGQIFPSDEFVFKITRSALNAEYNIINLYGVDNIVDRAVDEVSAKFVDLTKEKLGLGNVINVKQASELEVSQARGSYPNLSSRLDNVDDKQRQTTAQLAQTANKEALLKQAIINMSMLSKKELIVSDSFASGKNVLSTTETRQKWENLSGAFKITDGRVFSDAVSTWSKAIIETYANNVEISFAVRSFEGHPRILFRAKDTNNYWFFGIANQVETNFFVLAKIKDREITEVERITNSWDLQTSIGSRMRVVVNGNKVKCYINNYLVFDKIVDTDFIAETKHGISLYDTGGEINAFKIEAIEKINYPDNLIASVDNKLVSYDGNHLLLSEDGGRSYKKGISIQDVAIIKYVHLFGDGKIMFADHQKVYYTHDWKTYHESEVFDYDGSKFVPETYDNFSCYKNGTVKKIVDGKELAVWGNYSTVSGVQFSDKVKVWYTADKGATVKCCYVFNTPSTLPCRHIHAVDFNPNDETFWLQTGDEPVDGVDMSHWVKGTYDVGTDTWEWNQFASGLAFKTTNMIFHKDGYVYWSWDKTPGGAVRAPISTMGNVATHELLFETNKDCHFLIVGPSGDIAIFQTAWGGTELPRIFYYAPDGINFVRIVGSMPYEYDLINDAQYQTYWPINSDGKVLAGIQSLSQQNIRDWDRKPSIFIDDIIRENGYPNAFK